MNKLLQSQRMATVEDAVIPYVNALVRKYPDTVSLGQGVVHYPPPPSVAQAVKKLMNKKEYHLYGPIAGLNELHAALKQKLKIRNRITLNDDQCLFVTAGANMAFNAIVLALCDPGDEMIVLAPYYFNHKMTIEMCSCKTVIVNTDEHYQPIIEHIAAAITLRTRAVVSISPNNPSGCIYSQQTLTAINMLCAEHRIYHISDEAYEDFVYDDFTHFSPGSLPNSAAHTISMFSFSKSYGLASWRVGYMVVPRTLESTLSKVQDNILICPPTISQFAALECLNIGSSYIGKQKRQIADNRQASLHILANLADKGLIEIPHSQGAFYIFIALRNKECDLATIKKLITDYGVAAIPGSAFSPLHKHCIRISYGALSTKRIELGLTRLADGLSGL